MAKTTAKKTTETKVKRAKPTTVFAPMNFQDHTITQKRNGRFTVVTKSGSPVNGSAKETLLLSAKVLKGSFKTKTEAVVETPAT